MTDVLISASELADLLRKNRVSSSTREIPMPMPPDISPAPSMCTRSSPISRPRRRKAWQELKTKFADAFGKAGLSGKETAVIYEQSMNSGFGQSCRGYYLLTMLGYPKVKVLHGGFDAWAAAGLPVTTDVPTPVKARSPSCRKPATS